MRFSPTQIETFDSRQPYSCERKWWFAYAPNGPKIRGPQTPEQALGDALHKLNEMYVGGKAPERSTKPEYQMFIEGLPMLLKVLDDGAVAVEEWVNNLPGISGRIDLLTKTGVVDYKTTKALTRAKTSAQLVTNHQMVIYGLEWLNRNPEAHEVKLTHAVYCTTPPYETKLTSARVTRESLFKQFEAETAPIINKLRKLESATNVEQFEANRKSCRFCDFKSQCPGEPIVMTPFLKEFLNRAAVSPSATVTPTPEAPKQAPAAVLPPDAPKQAPAAVLPPDATKQTTMQQAAQPVAVVKPAEPARVVVTQPVSEPAAEAPPVETVKRGRGRPPGAKNKSKTTVIEATGAGTHSDKSSTVDNIGVESSPDGERVAVWFEMKVGQPNYSSVTFGARAESSVEADASFDDVCAKLWHKARSQVAVQLENFNKAGK